MKGDFILLTRNIVWTLLPFFFAWVIYQLKNSKLIMDRIVFVVKKADEIVEWIEEEFPDLPYVDKINKIIDILIQELKEAGYEVGSKEQLKRVAKAAYHRYQKDNILTEHFKKLNNING